MNNQRQHIYANITFVFLSAVIFLLLWPGIFGAYGRILLSIYGYLVISLLILAYMSFYLWEFNNKRNAALFFLSGYTFAMLSELVMFFKNRIETASYIDIHAGLMPIDANITAFFKTLLSNVPVTSDIFLGAAYLCYFLAIKRFIPLKPGFKLNFIRITEVVILALVVFIYILGYRLMSENFTFAPEQTPIMYLSENFSAIVLYNFLLISLVIYYIFNAGKIDLPVISIVFILAAIIVQLAGYVWGGSRIGHPSDALKILSNSFMGATYFSVIAAGMPNLRYTVEMQDRLFSRLRILIPCSAILFAIISVYISVRSAVQTYMLIAAALVTLIVIRGLAIIRENEILEHEKALEVKRKEELTNENIMLNQLLKKELEEEKQELEKAKQVHVRVLQNRKTLNLTGAEAASAYVPVEDISGDYHDFFPLDDSRTFIVMCDVMGKGLSSTLLTLLVRHTIRHNVQYFESPGSFLTNVNKDLFNDLHHMGSFTTMLGAVYEPAARKISISGAGFNPAIMVRASDKESCLLKTKGTAIGLKEDICFEEQAIEVAHGDVICLYSDGVINSCNSNKERYSAQRLMETIRFNMDKSADGIKDAVLEDLCSFMNGEKQRDDWTLIVIKPNLC